MWCGRFGAPTQREHGLNRRRGGRRRYKDFERLHWPQPEIRINGWRERQRPDCDWLHAIVLKFLDDVGCGVQGQLIGVPRFAVNPAQARRPRMIDAVAFQVVADQWEEWIVPGRQVVQIDACLPLRKGVVSGTCVTQRGLQRESGFR